MSNILIIEDEQAIARLVDYNLSAIGHQVLTGHTGEEGLGLTTVSSPDLVLPGLKMPGVSGWEVLHALRASREMHDVPAILMTASPGVGSWQEITDRGAQDRLNKPFGIEDLIEKVQGALGQRGAANAPTQDSDRG